MPVFLWQIWERWFGEALRKVEAESLTHRLSDQGRQADWKTMIVLLTTAACLTIQSYGSSPGRVAPVLKFVVNQFADESVSYLVETKLTAWSFSRADSLTWWACCTFLTYAIIPCLVIKLLLRERIRLYGTKLRGVFYCWPIYAVFVAVMIPLVWGFSTEDRFQATYPFFRINSREEVGPDFYRWEVLYALQFVALEFFFRGFVLHGTRHRFGIYAVFVMMVPYCMIHYGKPMPEAVASIIAGVALGLMSLVTRSVWLGAALHISVAWGMDFACLTRRGLLG